MNEAAPPHGRHHRDRRGGWRRWVLATDHTDIGTMYLVFAVVAGLVGGAMSLVLRMAPAGPPVQAGGGEDPFGGLLAAHGLIMVFFVVMPAIIGGFGNWVVPRMIGAPDMAFPPDEQYRLLAPGAVPSSCCWPSPFFGGPGDGPTTGAPGGAAGQAGPALHLAVLSLLLAGASSILAAANFITTIFNMRAPGVRLHAMPLFVWSILVTACLLLVSLPVLAAGITMLLADRTFAAQVLQAAGAGPIAFQHLFWFFAHPEVYILILPGLGMISQIVATFSGRPVIGHLFMAYAMVAIGFVGFTVWVHHMYTVGPDRRHRDLFHPWRASSSRCLWVRRSSPGPQPCGASGSGSRPQCWWAVGFVFLFAVGGATGVALAGAGLDRPVHDSHAVLAHFHYVLSMGAVFAIFGGFYHWLPGLCGRRCSEALGKLHFWLMFVGVNLTFAPQLFLGLAGAEGRVAGGRRCSGLVGLGVCARGVGLGARRGGLSVDVPEDSRRRCAGRRQAVGATVRGRLNGRWVSHRACTAATGCRRHDG